MVTGYDLGSQYIWDVYAQATTPAEKAESMRGTWQADHDGSANSVVFSSADLVVGETYTVTIGSNSATVTQSSTGVGNSNGFGVFVPFARFS